jgi:hypothetical protein
VVVGLLALTLIAEITWAFRGPAAVAATAGAGCPPPPSCVSTGGGGTGVGATVGVSAGGVLGAGISVQSPTGSLAFTGGPISILIVLAAGLLLVGLWSAAVGQRR